MENEVRILQAFLVFIPFGLLIGGYFLYLYIRGWRSATVRIFRQISSRLRNLQRQVSQIGKQTTLFLSDDPEPYGPVVRDVNSKVVEYEQRLLHLYQAYTEIQSTYSTLQHLSWTRFWQWSVLWRKVNQDINIFLPKLDTAEDELTAINLLVTQIMNLGWEVAQLCRQVLDQVRLLLHDVNEFREQGLGDSESEQVQVTLNEWESTLLNRIPVIFYSNQRSYFEQSADKNLVSKTFKIIQACEKEIGRFDDLLNQWKNEHRLSTQLVQSLVGQIKAIEQIVSNLEKDANHPVYWDLTRPKSDMLSSEYISLSKQEITVSHLKQTVERLQNLDSRLIQLQKDAELLLISHKEIVQLISQAEFARSMEWSRGALASLAESKNYHLDNWKGTSFVPDLNGRIQDLLAQQAKVIPRQISGTLVESKIISLLKSLNMINVLYEQVKPEFAIYFKRLEEIKGQENVCKNILSSDYACLKQTRAVVESNQYLNKLAGNEISRLLPAFEQLNSELDHPLQGTVGAKQKRIEEQHKKLELALQKWLEKLDEDIDKKKEELSKTVNVLQDLVSLNDPVFVDVVNLMQDHRQDNLRVVPSGQPPLLNQVHLMRVQSEFWQRILAANKAIEDIAGPVLDRHNKLEKNRQNLAARMARADESVPEVLSWPPTTVRLTNERARFRALEAQYISFKQDRHKAIQLVALISNLSDNYLELHTQVGQSLERASQEQNRLSEFEHRLHQSKSLWSQRLQVNNNNQTATNEIERLLNTIENDFSELQRRTKSGSLPYQQAYQMLRLICRKIDEATISLGANQIMDINGVVHRQL